METKQPQTLEEWQQVYDLAYTCVALEKCRSLGLINGGPAAEPARCLEILMRGKELGLHPTPGFVEDFAAAWNATIEAGIDPLTWDHVN